MCRLGALVAATVSLLGLISATRAQITDNSRPECKGVFDFYFVIDSSSSIMDFFSSDIVPFVAAVSSRYIDPNFRLSFITFATESHVLLNLTRTADQPTIQAAVSYLRDSFEVTGSTFLAPGLINVQEQIHLFGGDTASVTLVITDGSLVDHVQAYTEADFLQANHSVRIYAVGIGSGVQHSQLNRVTGNPNRVYIGNNFQFLPDIIDRIIEDICIEIISVRPEKVCLGATFEITLTGSGFTSNLNPNGVACRFTSGEQVFTTNPTATVFNDTIVCPAPDFTMTGTVLLEISLDGISYIASSVTMEIDDCKNIAEATPNTYCRNERPEITLRGSGFEANLDQPAAMCRYRQSNGQMLFTVPRSPILDSVVVCPSPDTGTFSGEMSLQVTTTGQFYIEDIFTITVEDCTGVSSVEPLSWCFGEIVETVAIRGSGFTEDLVQEEAFCEVQISSGELFVFSPVEIESDIIVCPMPDLNYTGQMTLRVSTNGQTVIGGTISLLITDCMEKDYTFVVGIILGLLALALLILLCMLWCCVPLITGTIIGGLPPEPKPATPPPTPLPPPPPPPPEPLPAVPGRKWEVVDASYYGGRGAGGMKPMKVSWGGKGATELGSKLTKAKDASVIEVIEKAGIAAPPLPEVLSVPSAAIIATLPGDKEPGCWDKLKKKLKRWYAVASSYRPVFTNHGTLGKKILWFPGPKGVEKATHTPSVEDGLGQGPVLKPPPPPRPSPYTNGGTSSLHEARPAQPPAHPPRRVAPPVPSAYQQNLLSDTC